MGAKSGGGNLDRIGYRVGMPPIERDPLIRTIVPTIDPNARRGVLARRVIGDGRYRAASVLIFPDRELRLARHHLILAHGCTCARERAAIARSYGDFPFRFIAF